MECRLSKIDSNEWISNGFLKINIDNRYLYQFDLRKAIKRKYDGELLFRVIVYEVADLIKRGELKLPVNFFKENGDLSSLGTAYFREFNRNLIVLIDKEIWPNIMQCKANLNEFGLKA